MGLVGEINCRVGSPVAEFGGACGMQRGQVRGGAAADKKAARSFRGTAEAAEPTDHSQLHGSRGCATEPGAVENVEPGRECVGHCADIVPRAGMEGEDA